MHSENFVPIQSSSWFQLFFGLESRWLDNAISFVDIFVLYSFSWNCKSLGLIQKKFKQTTGLTILAYFLLYCWI